VSSEVEEPVLSSSKEPAVKSGTPVPAKRLNPIKLKQIEERIEQVEAELTAIEGKIMAAEESLGHFVSAEESQRTSQQLEDLRARRAALTTEWESLATALEEQASAV
jgi:ATP-binding cassette subfamily F protein 3